MVADMKVASSDMKVASDLKPIYVPVDLAVPLGLIANEMLMEAEHRYSGQAPAELEVSLRWVDGRYILCVSSDGSRLQEVTQPHLGIELVQRLAKQIDAEVSHEVQKGRVTTQVFVRS